MLLRVEWYGCGAGAGVHVIGLYGGGLFGAKLVLFLYLNLRTRGGRVQQITAGSYKMAGARTFLVGKSSCALPSSFAKDGRTGAYGFNKAIVCTFSRVSVRTSCQVRIICLTSGQERRHVITSNGRIRKPIMLRGKGRRHCVVSLPGGTCTCKRLILIFRTLGKSGTVISRLGLCSSGPTRLGPFKRRHGGRLIRARTCAISAAIYTRGILPMCAVGPRRMTNICGPILSLGKA